MPQRILRRLPLAAAAITTCLVIAPVAAADGPECDIILPAADQLERAFNQVRYGAAMPPNMGVRIQTAESPLFGLSSPAAVDLRLWSSTLASETNGVNPYRPPGPQQLASDLRQARQQLAAAREYCAP